MSDLNQPFPQIEAPFTSNRDLEGREVGVGLINQIWLQLLIALWNRTGAAAGVDSSEALMAAWLEMQTVVQEQIAAAGLLEVPGYKVAQLSESAMALDAIGTATFDPMLLMLFEGRQSFVGISAEWCQAVVKAPTGFTITTQECGTLFTNQST